MMSCCDSFRDWLLKEDGDDGIGANLGRSPMFVAGSLKKRKIKPLGNYGTIFPRKKYPPQRSIDGSNPSDYGHQGGFSGYFA